MAHEAQCRAIPLPLFCYPLLWLVSGLVVLKQPVANDIKVVVALESIVKMDGAEAWCVLNNDANGDHFIALERHGN